MGLLDTLRKTRDPEGLRFFAWDAENSMVMSWLISSMEPDINQSYLVSPIFRDL